MPFWWNPAQVAWSPEGYVLRVSFVSPVTDRLEIEVHNALVRAFTGWLTCRVEVSSKSVTITTDRLFELDAPALRKTMDEALAQAVAKIDAEIEVDKARGATWLAELKAAPNTLPTT